LTLGFDETGELLDTRHQFPSPEENARLNRGVPEHNILGECSTGRGSTGSAVDPGQFTQDSVSFFHLEDGSGNIVIQRTQRPACEIVIH
jgi:hypothetical protein